MSPSALAVVVTSIALCGAALAGCERQGAASAPAAPKWDATAGSVTRASADPGTAHMHPIHVMTEDVEVLSGDPEAPGKPFVIRIRELPGSIVPPHRHPVDENITVVQGTWYFGTGSELDKSTLTALPAGSYAFAPAGTTMFGYAPHGAIVQVHGVGLFHIFWKHGSHQLGDADEANASVSARAIC